MDDDFASTSAPATVVLRPPQRGARLRAFWSTVAGLAVLIAAGIAFDNEGFSQGQLARGCDTGIGIGYVLTIAAGVLMGFGRIALDRRSYHQVRTDYARLWTLAVPSLVVLLLTLPSAIGCDALADLDTLGSVGDALLGAPGAVLAAAASLGLGVGVTSIVRVTEFAVPGGGEE